MKCTFKHRRTLASTSRYVIGVVLVAAAVGIVYQTDEEMAHEEWNQYYKERYSHIKGERAPEHGPMKRAPGHWYFYAQRLYGNLGVNVDRKLYEVSKQVKVEEELTLRKAPSDAIWTKLGPSNIAGRMRAIAFHPNDPDTIYAGAASGGIFKSVNGDDWEPIMDYTPVIPVGAIAIDKNNPNIIYAGTGEPVLQTELSISSPSYYGIGIVRSDDGGRNWKTLPWVNNISAVHRIHISPESADTLLVASMNNLYKSTNAGNSWVNALTGNITDLKVKEDNDQTLFAAVGSDNGSAANGVYRSFARGNRFTWKKLTNNFPPGDSLGRIILATTPADPNLVMAFLARARGLGSFSEDFFGIMKSTDAGDTWERLNTNLPKDRFGNGQLFYDFCAIISPTDPDLVFAGGINVWRSTNGGIAWAQITQQNLVHVDQHVMEFQPGTGLLWVGNDGGIYNYDISEVRWENKEEFLETVQYYSIKIDPRVPWTIYGGSQDNGTHRLVSKNDNLWAEINGGDGGYVEVDPTDSDVLFTTYTVVNYPFRSTNGGGHWSAIRNGLPSDFFNWITPMYLLPKNPQQPSDIARLYWAGQHLYVAEDATNKALTPGFSQVSDVNLTGQSGITSTVTTMAVSKSNRDYMYTGSGDGRIFRTRNLLDQGTVGFDDVTGATPNRWCTRVEVDPVNQHVVYATFSGFGSGHVFRTSNGGTDWRDISSNLPDIPVNSIKVLSTNSSILFIATDIGVWYSTNTGGSWQRYGLSLPNVVVHDIDFLNDNGEDYIVAATYGRGMWYAPVSIPVSAVNVPLASDIVLGQNYPNPVRQNSETRVDFILSTSENVRIVLYNSQGRKVQTLFEGNASSGRNSISVPTQGLANGIYYYRLESDGTVLSRKMIVM